MGISIDPALPDRDWSGMVKPTLEAIVKLIMKDYFDAAFKAHEASKQLRTKEETLEQRVWTLWRESLAIALPEFFVTTALTRRPDDEELSRLLQDILKDSEAVAKTGRAQFEDVHLRTPTDFPLYPSLREKLPEWARMVAPDHLRDDERLRERLDRAFERGFRRAFADRSEHFSDLRDYFAGGEAETEIRRDAWRRYYDGLSREIEEKPLFNQPDDGNGATLGAIFQPLRCYWREKAQRAWRDQPSNEVGTDTIHLAWLQSELEDWLEARRSSDALRVITGGPGCGKSSSALWFARDVAYAGSVNVFVIRLQGLDVDRPIDAIIKDFVAFSGSDHGMLEESPIDWLRDDPKPLLLVFDGLDEVARPDGEGLEVTKTFLRTLHTRLGQSNRDVKARIMALALGRPNAAEEATLAMGGSLGDQALLHVVSLSRMDQSAFLRPGERWDIGWDDPKQLADEDFRAAFYERYRPFDEARSGGGTPEALGDHDLAEMTTEPLLLYLLIISGYAGENWKLAKENRNRVYQRIFQGIHERDLKKPVGHPSKMGIEREEDFFALMECLGLAAWLGGGRSGSDEDFALIRDDIYLPERAGEFRDLPSAKLDNVALQTFTHRNDREKPGYAFIHKSFGDYLIARALVEAGDKWLRRYDGLPGEFARVWLQLTGRSGLSSVVASFMVDEVRLRMSSSDDLNNHYTIARSQVDKLTKVVNFTLREGLPAHDSLAFLRKLANWRQRELIQRNAEDVLYGLVSSWAETAYPRELLNEDESKFGWKAGPIKVEWPTRLAARTMLGRLRDQRENRSVIADLLFRSDLSGQDLEHADLSAQVFFGADMSGAILRRANLLAADMRGANCAEADLFGVSLFEANLSSTNLAGLDLGGADLRLANFRDANLNKALLVNANLSNANLSGANLCGADLYQANLCGADLSGADCSRMGIQSALVHGADFSQAINLLQLQLDRAYGDSKTKLPDGIVRPAHWLRKG